MNNSEDLAFPQTTPTNITEPNPTTEGTQRDAGPNSFRDGENISFMWADSIVSHTFTDNSLKLVVQTIQKINRTAQTIQNFPPLKLEC